MKLKRNTALYLIIIVLLVVLAWKMWPRGSKPETNEALNKQDSSINLAINSNSWKNSAIVALPGKEMGSPGDNNRGTSFSILGVNSTTGEKTPFGSIDAAFGLASFGLWQNNVYYINPAGRMESFQIVTKQKTSINTSLDTEPVDGWINRNNIQDLIVANGKIIYLRGSCAEVYNCGLGIVDIATGIDESIVSHLEKTIKGIGGIGKFSLVSVDLNKHTAKISNEAGDAGFGMVELYEVNLDNGKITKLASATNSECGEDQGAECTAAEKAKEVAYEKLNKEVNPVEICHGMEITTDWPLKLTSKSLNLIIENVHYVGCTQ